MKREKWVSFAQAAALAFLTALGGTGCMITAFALPLEHPSAVALTCAGSALLCAGASSKKGGGFALLFPAALAAGYLWRRGEAAQQLWQLVYRISSIYNRAYGWGVFRLVDTPWYAGAADVPMAILGAVTAWITARAVCRGRGTIPAILFSLLPLASCLVVTDTVPAVGYLFCLLYALVLLLLTGRVRSGDQAQGNRLTLLAALPTALALGCLLLAVPQKSYVNRSAELRDSMVTWVQSLSETTGTPLQDLSTGTGEPDSVALASIGRRIESTLPVMDVTAEVGGTLYLRGRDYDIYDGKGWHSSVHRVESFSFPGIDLGSVTVRTRSRLPELYLPYYPRETQSLIGGRLDNSRLYTDYTFPRSGLPDDWRTAALSGEAAGHSSADEAEGTQSRYLALPEAARSGAAPLLETILACKTTTVEKAEAIAAYVRGSARYDKNTGRMPQEQEDFALWFLRESDTGYCVHFATAATVLLRAAGIEARYVSGYLVRCLPGQAVTVTGENAHAWAEYYEPSLNAWLVLESTPADTNAPEAPPRPTAAPTEAKNQPTEAPPRPSAGTASTAPPSVTVRKQAPGWLGKLLKTILLLAVITAALEGQRGVRLRLRRRRQRRGTPNSQALARWQEAETLAKLLKEPPPMELEALAQKAKFSQHILAPEELTSFESYLRTARKQLRQMPWYIRLLHQYVFAIY